jgi:hypothetical protein
MATATSFSTPDLAALISHLGTGISQHARLLTPTKTRLDNWTSQNIIDVY